VVMSLIANQSENEKNIMKITTTSPYTYTRMIEVHHIFMFSHAFMVREYTRYRFSLSSDFLLGEGHHDGKKVTTVFCSEKRRDAEFIDRHTVLTTKEE